MTPLELKIMTELRPIVKIDLNDLLARLSMKAGTDICSCNQPYHDNGGWDSHLSTCLYRILQEVQMVIYDINKDEIEVQSDLFMFHSQKR
jgi:hypothetical protein